LVLLSPIFFILLPFKLSNFKKVQIFYNNGESEYILMAQKKGIFNFILMLINILTGKLSFVGAPISTNPMNSSQFSYKPGFTGLVQINLERIQNDQTRDNYELHYLKNQSLFLDIEIILQAFRKHVK
ncbi:MAG: sugar transferase, partial [Calditrichaceae bacterium]|nr:sugar transferase [Calditrichaceae bacterium]